jgi:hypothetical protein
MGLTDKLLTIKRIALDTSPFIYFFKKNTDYSDKIHPVKEIEVVTLS